MECCPGHSSFLKVGERSSRAVLHTEQTGGGGESKGIAQREREIDQGKSSLLG